MSRLQLPVSSSRVASLVPALLFALASLACSQQTVQGPVGPVESGPEPASASVPVATDAAVEPAGDGTFALVWFDAALHRSPDDPAALRAYDFGETPRELRPGQVFVARRLESRGPWVRLGGVDAWIDGDSRPIHCIGSDIFAESGVDIAVWVHEQDLAPALTAPLDIRNDDGTFVALTPGVPILGDFAWVDGFSLPVSPPVSSVGLAYRPVAPGPRSSTSTSLYNAPNFKASLGGQAVAYSQPVWSYGDSNLVSLTEEEGGGHHLIVDRCGGFEVAIEGEFKALPPGGVLGVGGISSERASGGAIVAGTPLLWPDGTPAGSAIADVRRTDLAPQAGPMTCIDVGVGRQLKSEGFRGEKATVCVETSRVEAVEM